jgi:hypothetical protein
MLEQPNTTTVNKLLNIFHRIILFYKSYYRHSTKVEKNRFGCSFTPPQELGLRSRV